MKDKLRHIKIFKSFFEQTSIPIGWGTPQKVVGQELREGFLQRRHGREQASYVTGNSLSSCRIWERLVDCDQLFFGFIFLDLSVLAVP